MADQPILFRLQRSAAIDKGTQNVDSVVDRNQACAFILTEFSKIEGAVATADPTKIFGNDDIDHATFNRVCQLI